MKLRKFETALKLKPCACGNIPGNNITVAGPVRLYQVICLCGRETEKTESYADAVSEWNEQVLSLESGVSRPELRARTPARTQDARPETRDFFPAGAIPPPGSLVNRPNLIR